MENKQTAVKLLYDQIIIFPKTNDDLAHNARSFHQAKAMEKEQIIKAYKDGIEDMAIGQYYKPKHYYENNYGNT